MTKNHSESDSLSFVCIEYGLDDDQTALVLKVHESIIKEAQEDVKGAWKKTIELLGASDSRLDEIESNGSSLTALYSKLRAVVENLKELKKLRTIFTDLTKDWDDIPSSMKK